MSTLVTKPIKRVFNKLGIDIVKYRPHYKHGAYAYLTALNIQTVLDIGAHSGEFASMIKQLLPEAAILSFEPLPDIFKQLEARLHHLPGCQFFNYALGDRNAQVEMNRNDYTQSSSLLSMLNLHKEAFPETVNSTPAVIEERRLDDVLATVPLKPEVLIKIDVQGYEDKVITGGEHAMSRARAVLIEVSFERLYEGQPLFDDLYNMLRARGFRYMGNLFQLPHPKDGRLLQADSLFVRDVPR